MMLDFITALITIASVELIAKQRWEGWAVGLVAQGLWIVLLVSRGMWGLLLLAVFLTWRYAAALLRWRRSAAVDR